jgi:hypothetical protein
LPSYDMESFRDVMELRAFAHNISNIAKVSTYRLLTQIYEEALTLRCPQGYRNPSIGEVMKSDRELHEEICFFVAGGQGTLQTALAWYTGQGRADCPFLKMLDPLPASMPDRAIESAPSSRVIEGGSSAQQLGPPSASHMSTAVQLRSAASAISPSQLTATVGSAARRRSRQRGRPRPARTSSTKTAPVALAVNKLQTETAAVVASFHRIWRKQSRYRKRMGRCSAGTTTTIVRAVPPRHVGVLTGVPSTWEVANLVTAVNTNFQAISEARQAAILILQQR